MRFCQLNRFLSLLMIGFTLLFTQTLWAESTIPKKAPTFLIIKKEPLTVNGKTVMRYRIEQPDGTWGYEGKEGEFFNVIVKNQTDTPTVLHWHGLVLPNNQDGVPNITQPPIPPGGQYHYYFKLNQAGTYWMHSHYQLQLQDQLAAPLIIDPAQPDPLPAQSVVMLMSDFSYQDPETIFAHLRQGMNMKGMSMAKMSQKPDLNDVQYDALLTNGKTLSHPQIVTVKPGQWVRLRLIDGAAATNFFIHLGALSGQLMAVDGEAIHPLHQSDFTLIMGQRLNILVKIPEGEGAYPILAQGEGSTLQTGLILATKAAAIPTIPEKNKQAAGAVTMTQELSLHALAPLSDKPVNRHLTVTLAGNMMDYRWTLNGKVWPEYTPLEGETGQRVEMVFTNTTGMSHPMHLHGHVFEVTKISGHPVAQGALHDTVLVPPHGSVTIVFDANNPGNWMIHCHVLYHAEGGMMGIYSEKNK